MLAPATDRVKSLIENDLGPAQLRQVKWKLQRCREKRAVKLRHVAPNGRWLEMLTEQPLFLRE